MDTPHARLHVDPWNLTAAVAAAGIELLLDATFTHSVEDDLHGRGELVPLLPEGAQVVREHRKGEDHLVLARLDDAALVLGRSKESVRTMVMTRSAERSRELLDDVRSRWAPVDLGVETVFWSCRRGYALPDTKSLTAPALEDQMRHYPPDVAAGVTSLAAAGQAPAASGLLLWHGPPGTGKTRAALALAHAWKATTRAEVVTDPERLFGDADYLVQVLHAEDQAGRARLIICEDADEYLRTDARARSGPGLGRLLNATDGLLAAGSRAVFLLTTNDDVGRLHNAVTRPGRCLGITEFRAFTPEQATAWLGRPVAAPTTIAELFHLRSGGSVPADEHGGTGAYL